MFASNSDLFQINIFVYWIEFLKYLKLIKKALVVAIKMLRVYGLQKMIFESLSNSNFDTFSVFPAFGKKMVKFSVKIPRRFDKILLILHTAIVPNSS